MDAELGWEGLDPLSDDVRRQLPNAVDYGKLARFLRALPISAREKVLDLLTAPGARPPGVGSLAEEQSESQIVRDRREREPGSYFPFDPWSDLRFKDPTLQDLFEELAAPIRAAALAEARRSAGGHRVETSMYAAPILLILLPDTRQSDPVAVVDRAADRWPVDRILLPDVQATPQLLDLAVRCLLSLRVEEGDDLLEVRRVTVHASVRPEVLPTSWVNILQDALYGAQQAEPMVLGDLGVVRSFVFRILRTQANGARDERSQGQT